MLRGRRFSKRTRARAGKRVHLTEDVRIDLESLKGVDMLEPGKKLHAIQAIHIASDLNQKYKVSPQDKSRGFYWKGQTGIPLRITCTVVPITLEFGFEPDTQL